MKFSLRKRPSATAPGITRDDVIAGYRLILGREPESEQAIKMALGHGGVEQLRKAFLSCEEFTRQVAPGVMPSHFRHDLDPGGQPIEVECEPSAMTELLAHVEKTWSQLGAEDPYWSVLSHDLYRGSNFEANKEAFWNSGQVDVVRLRRWLARNEITLPAPATCLEYGCGTGRVTRWLSQEFDAVIGCDISERHIQLARQAILPERSSRVNFVRIERVGTLDALPGFDLLFSTIVLQHNPPPLMAHILDRLLARLRPRGVAYFQVSTQQTGYRFVLSEYLSSVNKAETGMEMHVLPQRYVLQIAARNGCDVLEVTPDDWTASQPNVSTTFLVRKRTA